MPKIIELADKIQKLNQTLSNAIEAVGVTSLLLIMVITCADVIGAKVFLKSVPGALDIVMLAQTVAISSSVAATLIAGGHVSVEILVMRMKPWMRRITTVIVEVLNVSLFILIVFELIVYGNDLKFYGEMSPTAHIALYPFAYGIALATVPACIEICIRIVYALFGKEFS